MELQGSFLMDLLTSTDDRKGLLGLAILQRDSSQGTSALPLLYPFVLHRFISLPRCDKAGHFLGRKLAYTLVRTMPVYGSTWVTLANAIDRDVQAASVCGEDHPLVGEIGVCALRSVLAMPFVHIEEYVRSRWEAVLTAVTVARNTTLRLCGIDALIVFATPPFGMERQEMTLLVRRIVTKPRFAEMVRRLLVDPIEEICVRGFQLLSILQLTANSGDFANAGAPALLLTPTPQWLMNVLGLTVDVCQEITTRACRLPHTLQQCIQVPLTALSLAAARIHAPSISLVLTVSDAILRPSLRSDWNRAVIVNSANCLLSIVSHQPGLLISLYPHLTVCCDKIIIVLQQHMDGIFETISVARNSNAASATEAAMMPSGHTNQFNAELPSSALEALFSVLSMLPLGHRVRHCQALLDRCSTAHQKNPLPAQRSSFFRHASAAVSSFIPHSSFLRALCVVIARTFFGVLNEVGSGARGAWTAWSTAIHAKTQAAGDLHSTNNEAMTLEAAGRYLGGFIKWLGENAKTAVGREIIALFLQLNAGEVALKSQLVQQLAVQLHKQPSPTVFDSFGSALFSVSNVLRMLTVHVATYFDSFQTITMDSGFHSILMCVSALLTSTTVESGAALNLTDPTWSLLRCVLNEFDEAFQMTCVNCASAIAESIGGSAVLSSSSVLELLHLLATMTLSVVSPSSGSILSGLRQRDKTFTTDVLMHPSDSLCAASLSVVRKILLFESILPEGSTLSQNTDVALTPEFDTQFSMAVDVIKLLYTASLRRCEQLGPRGDEQTPVLQFVHEVLLPTWAGIVRDMGNEKGITGTIASMVSNANTALEQFAFSSTPLSDVLLSLQSRSAQLLAAAPLFIAPSSRWGEGTIPTLRRIFTKTLTATGDPVQVTLSYVILPTSALGHVEVAATLTNSTSMCLQQILFQFSSCTTTLHDEGENCIAEIHLMYSHQPKRSLFATTSVDATSPSSSSHIVHRGRGCFSVNNFPPRASVILPGVFLVRRRFSRPLDGQFAKVSGGTSSTPSTQTITFSDFPLNFGCRVDVSMPQSRKEVVDSGIADDEDLVAVAHRAASSAPEELLDDDDDDDDGDGALSQGARKRCVVVLCQRTVPCYVALHHVFFHSSHLNLPLASSTVCLGIYAVLKEMTKSPLSLLPFHPSSAQKNGAWKKTFEFSEFDCRIDEDNDGDGDDAFPLYESGLIVRDGQTAAWVSCLPTGWIFPSDSERYSPLLASSHRFTTPMSVEVIGSVDYFSVELRCDEASSATAVHAVCRCSSRLWGALLGVHPGFHQFLRHCTKVLMGEHHRGGD